MQQYIWQHADLVYRNRYVIPGIGASMLSAVAMALVYEAVLPQERGRAMEFGCKEIYVKKPTLEDVFLNLTGEKLFEGGQ